MIYYCYNKKRIRRKNRKRKIKKEEEEKKKEEIKLLEEIELERKLNKWDIRGRKRSRRIT